jgi:hypothetical protein
MHWLVHLALDRLVNGRAIVLLNGFVILPLRLFVILHSHAVGSRRFRLLVIFARRHRRSGRLLAILCERFSRQNCGDVTFGRVRVNGTSGRTAIIRSVRSVLRRRQLAAESSTAAAASASTSLTAATAGTSTTTASTAASAEIAASFSRTIVGLPAIHIGRSAGGRWRRNAGGRRRVIE